MGTKGRIALQTTEAVFNSGNGNLRVRVLFDAGSHRSSKAGLQVKRREWIEAYPFREQTKESDLKGVYDLQVFLFQGGGGDVVKVEAYEVPTIAQIRNEHIEIRKSEQQHMQGLWLSDVSRDLLM